MTDDEFRRTHFNLLTADEVRAHMKLMAKGFAQMDVGQNDLARRIGISNGHLSRVLRGEKEPGEKVLRWFGLRAETMYRRR